MAPKQSTLGCILAAEDRLGIPLLFYAHLLEERDDWSFILKLHSLFEGVLHEVIRVCLKYPETGRTVDAYGWEEFSYRAKVELALELEILEPDYANFLTELYRLRNRAVHELRHLRLDLREMWLSGDLMQRQAWVDGFGAGWQDVPATEWLEQMLAVRGIGAAQIKEHLVWFDEMTRDSFGDAVKLREFMLTISPRSAIWFAGVWTFDLLSLKMHYRKRVDSAVLTDPAFHARKQDLLHDHSVLKFKRKVFGEDPGLTAEEQDRILYFHLAVEHGLKDLKNWNQATMGKGI